MARNDQKEIDKAKKREDDRKRQEDLRAAQAGLAEKARKTPSGKTAMIFNIDAEYEGVIYTKGEIYDIPNDKVDRWLKRSCVIATDAEVARMKAYKEDLKAKADEAKAADMKARAEKNEQTRGPVRSTVENDEELDNDEDDGNAD